MEEYVIAFDVGTSGVKSILTDTKGNICSVASASYGVLKPRANWAEQDPRMYWDSVCCVSRQALAKAAVPAERLIGMAFCTMWKGIIPVTRSGEILYNNILWLDARAKEESQWLNEKFGEPLFSENDYWPKLTWLRRHEPAVYKKADVILDVNGFLKWKATGSITMDLTNDFVDSYDPEIDAMYRSFLQYSDLDRAKFPPLCDTTQQVGVLSAAAAAELGLAAGTPVFGGCNDIAAINIGTGCAVPGGVHAYFGSSGWLGFFAPHRTGEFRISSFSRGWDVSCHGLQAIGLAQDWVLDATYAAERKAMGKDLLALFDQQVAQIPPGSEGLFCTPWFFGDLPPMLSADARGCFLNIGALHDRRHMARAMMEGVAYSLKMRMERYKEDTGAAAPEKIHMAGGGSASRVWMQIMADVLETDIMVPANAQHAGALGAAMCALVGLHKVRDLSAVSDILTFDSSYTPQAETQHIYREGYELFKTLRDVLSPVFKRNH